MHSLGSLKIFRVQFNDSISHFLIHFFCTFSYQTSSKNHFLVPAVMLGVFSMFGEGLIDQKVGPLDQLLRFVTASLSTIKKIIVAKITTDL